MSPDEIQRLAHALTLPGQVAYMDASERTVRIVDRVNQATGHAMFKYPEQPYSISLRSAKLSDFRLIQNIP